MAEQGLQGEDDIQARFRSLHDGTATRQVLGRFGLLAVQRAKERVPRKTGTLDRTIRVGDIDVENQSVRILAGGTRLAANQHGRHDTSADYAPYVEFGTRPHVIRAKNRKALAWGGARRLSGSLRKGAKPTHFARSVNHPGTRARPFLRPGAQQALDEVGLADVVIHVWNSAA